MPISDLKTRARNIMRLDHWNYVLYLFLVTLIIIGSEFVAVFIPFGPIVIDCLVLFPLTVGLAYTYMKKRITGHADVEDVFSAYKNNFGNTVLVMFMRSLFVFLWGLLFIIPGIIKQYEYSMVPYILAENPDVDYKDALDMSKKMTYGYKFNLFLLDLSFIGWVILSFLTFGILLFMYVGPYMNLTRIEVFYFLKWNSFGHDNPYRYYENLKRARYGLPPIEENKNEEL